MTRSGQDLPRGAVLGKISATGKYVLSDTGAGDGSEDPVLVLAEAVDASGGDRTSAIYETGEFNQDTLTFGTGHSASTAATKALGLCRAAGAVCVHVGLL